MMRSTQPSSSRCSRSLRAGAALVVSGLLLAGCTPGDSAPAVAEPEATPTSERAAASVLEDFDFGNTDWLFVDHTEMYPAQFITVTDGTADVGGSTLTVITDEVLLSDADGDGDLDAIVPVEAYGGGNSVDRQWYIWADEEGEAVQVEMPVARTIHCGTVTDRVEAVDGGFEILEFRHGEGDENIACAERGSDKRTRTVGISDEGPRGSLWPVQIAPFPGYGGICPASAQKGETPVQREAYTVPNSEAEPITAHGMDEWELESWSIYSMTVPEWRLVGIRSDADAGCAWVAR